MPFPFAAAAPFLLAGMNIGGGLFGAHQQSRYNRRYAAEQHGYNMELMRYQNEYNSPSSQMQRFRDAGLNPNLMYGQGSSGNMESAPRYPDIKPGDYQSALSGVGTQVQQARLMSAQADLTEQKVNESGVKQDLMKAQTNLVKANPYMKQSYVNALVTNLESAASLKKQEADFMSSMTSDQSGVRWQRGFLKMQRELDLLFQKFSLGEKDQQIKAQILESKNFQNAILEVQKKWMTEQEITPQHIYQGIMLLLSKMM